MEIVDLPYLKIFKDGDFPVRYVNVYQRLNAAFCFCHMGAPPKVHQIGTSLGLQQLGISKGGGKVRVIQESSPPR